MSRFSQIDLSQLPPPDVIETLDYDALLTDALARMADLMPEVSEALALESEPLRKLIELLSYTVLLLRARINDAARATMLATATGADLENLAALFGVSRLLVSPATDNAAAVWEADAALRARAQLAPEAYTTAGSVGAYEYHARAADPRVQDVSVTSPSPGEVLVTILANTATGVPPAGLLSIVQEALSEPDLRPLCHGITVAAPTMIAFSVTATIEVGDGPDAAAVLAAARTALDEYLASVRRIGATVAVSGILAALHRPSVIRVAMTAPAADIVCAATSAPRCTAVNLTTEVGS
ncbi:baseplate J/gp47 family protein [Rhodobacter capsulatus]|uniref:Phage-related baseplate assembly protein n=1 Tax=Rhodobacter capsulatus TaxID=1061 RepID=A0A1G7SDS1_RHOCA|nr:baseplate J/gp47 family protein [Rhodobacter capsulatus]WER10176.1 baseplate J/gp47 family protein [Rhodobacter capsulatus]SDG21178.1 Phage-related baseplate assembly protein [Rhodobacter capsulatus]